MPIVMKDLARLGAQTRLAELAAEIDSIERIFPDLGGTSRTKSRRPTRSGLDGQRDSEQEASDERPARKRKPMSAAAKKAVGERMRKYWAERRKSTGAVAADGVSDGEPAKTPVKADKTDKANRAEKTDKSARPKAARGRLSAAGRAAISAAQKKRWASRKRAGKKPGKKR
jgi:hypothetical protein